MTRGWFRKDETRDHQGKRWSKAAAKRPWDRLCGNPRHDWWIKLADRAHAASVSWQPTSVPRPCRRPSRRTTRRRVDVPRARGGNRPSQSWNARREECCFTQGVMKGLWSPCPGQVSHLLVCPTHCEGCRQSTVATHRHQGGHHDASALSLRSAKVRGIHIQRDR